MSPRTKYLVPYPPCHPNGALKKESLAHQLTIATHNIRTRTTKNNLLAGTYVQPVNVWVQGEQAIPGTAPPPYDFSQMPWLTQGVGIDEDGNLWGPLDPFPQTGVLIDAPQCGDLSAANFRGDVVDTDWVPSGECLVYTPYLARPPFPRWFIHGSVVWLVGPA